MSGTLLHPPSLNLPIPRSPRSFSSRLNGSTGNISPPAILSQILGVPSLPHLTVTQRAELGRKVGPHLEEFISLAGERDAGMFWEGLLQLGSRLEQEDRLEAAGAVLAAVAGRSNLGPGTMAPEGVRIRAQQRLDAMTGVGGGGLRAEFLLRRLSQEATEPTALFGMAVAGATFRLTRLATLSRLAATPQPGFLTRVLGRRAVAGLTGFAFEAAAFPMATRLGNAALGREQVWSSDQLGRELAGSFFVLGGLKFAGWGTTGLFNRVHGVNPLTGQATRLTGISSVTQRLMPQVGMLGGIMLGHQAETWAGLRPHLDNATTFTDSLAMLLQFNVAGRLTRHVFGEGFRRWERQMDIQAETLARHREGTLGGISLGGGLNAGLVPALVPTGTNPSPGLRLHNSISGERATGPVATRPLMMENHDPQGSGAIPPTEPPLPGPPSRLLVHEALETFRENHGRNDPASIQALEGAVRTLTAGDGSRAEARALLIGRTDFSPDALNTLYQGLRLDGVDLLTNPNIQRVLIPNRGEIAKRLSRTIVAQGLKPIVVVPRPEANSQWAAEIVTLGGEIRVVDGATEAEAYTNAYKDPVQIAQYARDAKAEAVHPGYGYLSENPNLARELQNAGVVLMGPSVKTLERAGDKDVAKRAFQEAGVPVVPGTDRGYTNVEELVSEIREKGLTYPLRLKAVGGGGGRGQKTVYSEAELRQHFPGLSAQVLKDFGNGAILAERFISRFQHVEFQILADRFGNVIQLGERECTLQERDQKLIEIHPARIFERFPGLRERMAEASVTAARAVGYTGHGTVEFMVDPVTGEFFAMEVNARIQVEHRVTEAVTGVDLVSEAIRVARGLPLSIRQSEVQPRGAAVEVRIKAVDPERRNKDGNAIPAPGMVDVFRVLGTEDFDALAQQGIFVETSVRPGDRVANADPMIAKIIVTGENRLHAIERAAGVLRGTQLTGSQGFKSDLSRQITLLETQTVREGTYDNRFVGRLVDQGFEDRAQFPYVQSGMVMDGGRLAPTHLEVAAGDSIPDGSLARNQGAWSRLLTGTELDFQLSGPVAALLRTEETAREAFAARNGSRSAWVQTDSQGGIRQAVIFEDHRPRDVFLAHRGRLRVGEDPVPLAIHLNFPAGTTGQVQAALYRLDGEVLQTVRSLGNGEVRPVADHAFRVFPLSHAGLEVRLLPFHRQQALEVRDRQGNLLVSVSPARVMESPAKRILALFELLGQSTSPTLAQQTERGIDDLIRQISSLPPANPVRRSFVQELGSTPHSIISRLLHLMEPDRTPQERALLGEVMAYREIVGIPQVMSASPQPTGKGRRIISYDTLVPLTPRTQVAPADPAPSGVRFVERDPTGAAIQRLMIRSRAAIPMDYLRTLEEAVAQLRQLQARHTDNQDNVIQVVVRRTPALHTDDGYRDFLQESILEALGKNFDDLRLKRITFIVYRENDYPNYYTFRREGYAEGNRTGPFVEDTRYRDVHPMLAHYIELDRLENFDLERDLQHSDRFAHLYYGTNKPTRTLKAGEDYRLFGTSLIPEARVIRDSSGRLQEIPEVEAAFVHLANAMQESLAAHERKPNWNRMFLNIQSVLPISEQEASAYAELLAIRHRDRLRGLGLEKVVVKGRLAELNAPGGYRPVLIRVSNPTGFRFEPQLHNIVRANVRDRQGMVEARDVLIRNGVYEKWLAEPHQVIAPGDWAPADIPIRPSSPEEIREQRARGRGAVWAYRIPALIAQEAENFRVEMGLGRPRPLGSEPPPPEEAVHPSHFVELDLDPRSVRMDPRTQMIDYNVGELIPALEAEGNPRALGKNQAGVVIGIQTDHLGIGLPARRMVILGDLTHHPSRGSLSANECARINAAIRQAAREGIPVDWYTASSGAEIHAVRGVDGLDATASTAREIIEYAHSLGVPINLVVDDVNIGAQSYWNSLASIIHDSGGVLIMTPRGSMALTGPDAWTAAMLRDIHSEDLPGRAKSFYPNGLQSLAGYEEIHGPNGEAMALAPNIQEATRLLLRHHYFSYRAPNSPLVGLRAFGGNDPNGRPVTTFPTSQNGRTVGQEIANILAGRAGNREAILEALRDQGSPAPIRWWRDAQGIRHQPGGNGLMPQRFGSIIQEMQMGGRPILAIFPPVGPLTPADSEIIARAIRKANARMPVMIIGSLSGFNGDPRSMENRQLFGGASIAEAIVRHRGPIVVVDMGYIVGGTFVVVSKQLNPNLRFLAIEGAHAQVIGGPSAAKVVFRGEIRRQADRDPRVVAAMSRYEADVQRMGQRLDQVLNEVLEAAPEGTQTEINNLLGRVRQSDERSETLNESGRRELENLLKRALYQIHVDPIRRQVISEIEIPRAAEFDAHHSVQRAVAVGSLDEVVSPQQLRERIIFHLDAGVREYLRRTDAAREQVATRAADGITQQEPVDQLRILTGSLERIYGLEGAREIAQRLAEGLRNFASNKPGGSEGEGGGGTSGSSGPGDPTNPP